MFRNVLLRQDFSRYFRINFRYVDIIRCQSSVCFISCRRRDFLLSYKRAFAETHAHLMTFQCSVVYTAHAHIRNSLSHFSKLSAKGWTPIFPNLSTHSYLLFSFILSTSFLSFLSTRFVQFIYKYNVDKI